MSLMDGLGLDEIEADPNALPDGKWAGTVFKSEYVYVKKNDSVAHVITYMVTEGDRKGAQRQEWFTIGTNPVRDPEGKIISCTPTMSEVQKRWYKKRFVDLGIPEQDVTKTEPSALVGKSITFGTKKNGEYININFVELRGEGAPGDVAPATSGIEGLL